MSVSLVTHYFSVFAHGWSSACVEDEMRQMDGRTDTRSLHYAYCTPCSGKQCSASAVLYVG